MEKKKRIPVIAAVLSLVAPGLGQLYNGQIFNRDNSTDSRHWGSIPLRNIKGKPLYIYLGKG
jgi:hypothetical protein